MEYIEITTIEYEELLADSLELKALQDSAIQGKKAKKRRNRIKAHAQRRAKKLKGLKAFLREKREALKLETTKSEALFKAYLKALEYNYTFQKIYAVGETGYIVDFFLKDYNIVVEIDGGYHTNKEQIKKDHKRTKDLLKWGVAKVLRFTDKQVEDKGIQYVDDYLKKVLNK